MPSFVVEESLNSVRVFWLQQEKLIEEIRKIAERVGKENPVVKEIVLFGSLAQKRGVPGSDADILIVLWKDDRPFPERVGAWLAKFDLDFPVEVFPYTVDELGNPLAQEALSKGMRLFTFTAPLVDTYSTRQH